MKNTDIDKVIERFNSFLPHGANYYDSTYDFDFEEIENDTILKFLVDNDILVEWGEYDKHILSPKGKAVFFFFCGIDKFLTHEKEESAEKNRVECLKNEKLFFDAKLSKWKVKTFWIIFIFGLFGGFYSIYSIIHSIVVGESEDLKIERTLEKKLLEREHNKETSTYQTGVDTLSK